MNETSGTAHSVDLLQGGQFVRVGDVSVMRVKRGDLNAPRREVASAMSLPAFSGLSRHHSFRVTIGVVFLLAICVNLHGDKSEEPSSIEIRLAGPSPASLSGMCHTLCLEAQEAFKAGRPREGFALLERALGCEPASVEAWETMAQECINTDDIIGEIRADRRLTEIEPERARRWMSLGQAICIRLRSGTEYS